MRGSFDEEFDDVGISGPSWLQNGWALPIYWPSAENETRCRYAVDRLGRDALGVQSTVRLLLGKGVVRSGPRSGCDDQGTQVS